MKVTPNSTAQTAPQRTRNYAPAPSEAQGAAASQPMSAQEFQRAVTRMTQKLDGAQPVRQDVPRGFYLNVRV